MNVKLEDGTIVTVISDLICVGGFYQAECGTWVRIVFVAAMRKDNDSIILGNRVNLINIWDDDVEMLKMFIKGQI